MGLKLLCEIIYYYILVKILAFSETPDAMDWVNIASKLAVPAPMQSLVFKSAA
jgi:hypothetical protein